VRERESERESERERERERESAREKERKREKDTKTQTKKEREKEREREMQQQSVVLHYTAPQHCFKGQQTKSKEWGSMGVSRERGSLVKHKVTLALV
jgi:hypothetical protein